MKTDGFGRFLNGIGRVAVHAPPAILARLTRDFLPSSWGTYRATKWDYAVFVGTLGFFTFMFLLFVRFLPMIPMNEIRMILPQAKIKPKATVEAGD